MLDALATGLQAMGHVVHVYQTARRIPIASIIQHGIDTAAHPLGDGRGSYALFLGRMTPDKGVHGRRPRRSRGRHPSQDRGQTTGAGRTQLLRPSYFDRVVAPLLGREVEYVGEAGGRDKIELMRNAVCLLNPVQWPEPFGMVMIEALACGTPVVATPCGSVPEL